MDKKYVYKIVFGSYNDKHTAYTAYVNQQGKIIPKSLAIRHVIERLRLNGEREQKNSKIERDKYNFAKTQNNLEKENEYLDKSNDYLKRAKNSFNLSNELNSINKDPDSDSQNLLTIEIVPYVSPPKKSEISLPEKKEQLEFKFGPTSPLNIKEAFKKSINEMMEADVVGVASTRGGAVGNEDSYAEGDARVPKSIFGGVIFKRPAMDRRKKKKKKRLKKRKN